MNHLLQQDYSVVPTFTKKRQCLRNVISHACLLGAGLISHSAWVQSAEIEEILVVDELRDGYRTDQSSLSKLTESLLDTPQSITIISGQLLEDRNAMSLDDALRNVPGITLGAGEFSWQGNNPTIRGFSSRNDMFLDGMRDLGYYTRDPFNLEAVEVLLGPSSMVFGRGSTGGVINQSSKKPMQRELHSLHVNTGNASTTRVTADINQPLQVGENSAFRINLLGHKAEVPGRDVVETERYGVAPSLSLGLGSATQLTLSYMRMESDSVPDYGLPWVGGRPADVDRENFYGFSTDYLETDADITTAILDHSFNETLSLNAQVRYADYSRRSRITEPQVASTVSRSTPAEDVTAYRMMFSGESEERMLQGQLNLRADFNSGELGHTLMGGVEMSGETSDPAFGFASQTPFFDYDLPVPSTNLANPEGEFNGLTARRLQADTNSDTLAAFVLDTVKINEQWLWNIGIRWDRFGTNYIEYRYDVDGTQTSSAQYITEDTETSYRSALVYKPVPEGSVYLGWGTSFNPSSEAVSFISSGRGLGVSNVNLDPEENESLELGTKWSLMDDRLHVDGALFRITKDNARVADPLNPGFNTLAGEQEILGISFNLTGQVSDSLQVITGYTWLDDEQKNPVTGGSGRIANVAKSAMSLWVDWAASQALDFGAGARYLAEREASSGKTVDDYWVVDAMGRYQLNENLSLKLNLTNLTNEYYIDQIHPWHAIPGHGFGAVFAVNLDY